MRTEFFKSEFRSAGQEYVVLGGRQGHTLGQHHRSLRHIQLLGQAANSGIGFLGVQ